MIEDRWEAIRWAIGSAQTDDCVVIVGRGHKDYVDWVLGDEIARVSRTPFLHPVSILSLDTAERRLLDLSTCELLCWLSMHAHRLLCRQA